MSNNCCSNTCGSMVKVPFAFKVEMFFFNLRMALALMICPALRAYADGRYNQMDDIADLTNKYRKEVRARDKAIARLQRERRDLRYQVKALNDKLVIN